VSGPRRWWAAALLPLLLILPRRSTPAAPQVGGYAPGEWQSITVTRFGRSLVVGPRYVLVAGPGGVSIFDRTTEHWSYPFTRGDGLPTFEALQVTLAADGRFLVRTHQGSGYLEPSEGRFDPTFAGDTGQVVRRPALPSNLFAGPDYQYLSDGRISDPTGQTVAITDLADEEGAGLWLTTWGLGSGRADRRTLRLDMKPHGLWSADVRALALAPDRLVAGGLGDAWAPGGLTEWRFPFDRWQYARTGEARGLASDRVYALALDGPEVWAAVEGGVVRGRFGGNWRFWGRAQGLPDERTHALAVSAGVAWIGLMEGAAVITADTIRTVPLPFHGRVRDIAAGPDAVWLATDQGAFVYRGRWPEGVLARLEAPGGRLDGQVDAVGVGKDEVWWSGPAGVVGYQSRTGKWLASPPVGPFLPGESHDVAVDDVSVWVATASGVWRLIRSSGVWHMYDEQDGLIDRRVWTVVAQEGRVWFGTASGITCFDWRLRVRTP
jgi:hypothetical protein